MEENFEMLEPDDTKYSSERFVKPRTELKGTVDPQCKKHIHGTCPWVVQDDPQTLL